MCVELLLNRTVNRPTVDFETQFGHTALSWAAFHSRLTVMQILIERGAEVNRFVVKGFEPAAVGALPLLNRIARCNKEGKTALMFAASNGKSDAVNILLELGADADIRDIHNKKAVDYADDYVDVKSVLAQMKFNHIGKLSTLSPRCGVDESTQEWTWGRRYPQGEGGHGNPAHPVLARLRPDPAPAYYGGSHKGRLPEPPRGLQVGLWHHRLVLQGARGPREQALRHEEGPVHARVRRDRAR
jgi:hypothetical protein